jgi:hypothetical protein
MFTFMGVRIFTILKNAWNLFWWNHHVKLARMHDYRLRKSDPEWRDKLQA